MAESPYSLELGDGPAEEAKFIALLPHIHAQLRIPEGFVFCQCLQYNTTLGGGYDVCYYKDGDEDLSACWEFDATGKLLHHEIDRD